MESPYSHFTFDHNYSTFRLNKPQNILAVGKYFGVVLPTVVYPLENFYMALRLLPFDL